MFRTSVIAIREKLAKLPQQSNASSKQSSADAKRRKSTLRSILRKLKRGGHVQNRQLQTWLTEEEFAEFESRWAEQRELRAELKRKPSSIVKYEVLLKRGLFAEAKADGYKRANAKTEAKAFNDAQRHFEIAIEFLTEQLQLDPSLAQWIDRNISNSAKDATALCGSAMPRCVTSRSADKASGGLQSALQKKIDVKITVVERALERCG
jgi:hypothetical protein